MVIMCVLQIGKQYQIARLVDVGEEAVTIKAEQIPITSLPARLVVMAQAYSADLIELKGNKDYAKGIAEEIKKLNSNLLIKY